MMVIVKENLNKVYSVRNVVLIRFFLKNCDFGTPLVNIKKHKYGIRVNTSSSCVISGMKVYFLL